MGACISCDQAKAGDKVASFDEGETVMEHHSAALWRKAVEKDFSEVPEETKLVFAGKDRLRDVSEVETNSPSSCSDETDNSFSEELSSELQTVEDTSDDASAQSSPTTVIFHGGATPKSTRSRTALLLPKTPKSSRMADFPDFAELRQRGDESNTCQKLEAMVQDYWAEESNPFCLPMEDDVLKPRRYFSGSEESLRVIKSHSLGSVSSMKRTASDRMRSARQGLARRVRRWLPRSSGRRIVPTPSWASSNGVSDDYDDVLPRSTKLS